MKDLRTNANPLSSLDISNNTLLTKLNCYDNGLATLDVTSHTLLTELTCGSNDFVDIDISNNTRLTKFSCGNSDFTNIDVSNNTLLTDLYINSGSLTSLDISKNTAITNLQISSNESLTSIDLSNNTVLKYLYCHSGALTSLDLSNNTELYSVRCYDSALTSLNVANGNNTNLYFINATNNPDLACIQVDDVDYSIENWSYIDETTSFSQDCSATAGVVDNTFKAIEVYPNPVKNTLNIHLQSGEFLKKATIYSLFGEALIVSEEKELNMSELSSGVYLLKLENEKGEVATRKLIKE